SLGPTAEVYHLSDPLANQELGLALETLLDLLENSLPMPLLYTIGSHFLKLLKFKYTLALTNPAALAVQRPLGFHPYTFDKMRTQAGKWSWSDLSGALGAVLKAHRTLVTSSTPQQIVLEELTVSLGTFCSRQPL
ncbi:MAG: hypothetical protein LBK52_05135, partial [Deltaproteobacteria bacterium]|nr:hypothetical protein [Deltaproteobacteria bacterium]